MFTFEAELTKLLLLDLVVLFPVLLFLLLELEHLLCRCLLEWLRNVVVLVQVLLPGQYDHPAGAIRRPCECTYDLSKQQYILSSNQEQSTLDVCVEILNE